VVLSREELRMFVIEGGAVLRVGLFRTGGHMLAAGRGCLYSLH
jgi:hypothetical protein